MKYPKIFLAADNCFAIKRWVKPSEWMRVTEEIGLKYIEASTDNECDPLFATAEYLEDWVKKVSDLQKKKNMKVVNFYTGYQTYRTVGLAHHDKLVRNKLLNEWLKPMVNYASQLEAGLGFSYFALPDEILQNPDRYEKTRHTIIEILSELINYAWEKSRVIINVEQMYAPHQPPWTIQGAKEYIKDLYGYCKKPSYITIDVGHQIGQKKFKRLDFFKTKDMLKRFRSGEWVENMWLGPESAYNIFFNTLKIPALKEDPEIQKIEREMDRYPYLFANDEDGDTYRWLEELGCYSPIMHIQQNDGMASHHAPFTEKNNRTGIIKGDRLLEAIAKSYEQATGKDMPPKCDNIYLSLEIFSANTDMNYDIIKKLRETVTYWRKFIPEDGLRLDELT